MFDTPNWKMRMDSDFHRAFLRFMNLLLNVIHRLILTHAGKVTNKLSTLILRKMAERSEAKTLA